MVQRPGESADIGRSRLWQVGQGGLCVQNRWQQDIRPIRVVQANASVRERTDTRSEEQARWPQGVDAINRIYLSILSTAADLGDVISAAGRLSVCASGCAVSAFPVVSGAFLAFLGGAERRMLWHGRQVAAALGHFLAGVAKWFVAAAFRRN